MIRRFLGSILLATALSGAAATVAPADSLNRQVAVFVASNMKIAVDNALAQLAATGVQCDTAIVRRMIAEELVKPYDRAEHDAANAAIDAAMSRMAAEQAGLMLAQAAAEEGAEVLPDGLIIRTLVPGDTSSPSPVPASKVAIRYTGYLPDGSVFDSIGADEEPIISTVAELTPGIAEGLTHMHRGGKYTLTLPAQLAYGSSGVPGVIPPDCPLRFDVELINVE
ncbi:MAG: FKBP-type peptidyl-prolyl cis-trans isomerase [Muribaculaceae bacterium]|nr:FKBP-type peptidyl-prolyl cis-trans isomerase [Muribaculaceae bacterium]